VGGPGAVGTAGGDADELRVRRLLGRGLRVRLYLVLVYLSSPIDLVPDLVPDVVPVIGYADDAVIVAFVLRSVVRRADPGALRRYRPGSLGGLAAVHRLAGVPPPAV